MDNQADPPPFEYQHLPGQSHIRLLERLDKAPDGTLRFAIKLREIDQGPEFHCISYTWGNPFAHGNQFREHFDSVAPQYAWSNKIPILVNDRLLYIHKNLHDALSLLPQDAYVEYMNRPMDGRNGQSYLHVAACNGRTEHVKVWLRCGANPHRTDNDGRTALHYAADEGHVDCVKTLLCYDALKDAQDNDGGTPLSLAMAKGHDNVVDILQTSSSSELGERDPPIRPDKLVWADAICINQADVEEKSAQVSMMDRIYSTATYVTAWLGPHDSHSSLGIQTLNTLHSHLAQFQDSRIEPFSGLDKEEYTKSNIPVISWPEWVALASIYQRQWFSRAWIVQEAILPTVLLMYLGSDTISWAHLGDVSATLRRNEAKLGTASSTAFVPEQDAAVPVVWNMAEVSKWRQTKSNANRTDISNAHEFRGLFTLREMVYNFWTFLASDSRDKIFAFYGVLNMFSSTRWQANYRLSLASVYTSAAREIIREEGNLQTLSACVYPLKRIGNLPTWVPDFSLPAINGIPSQFSADAGLAYTSPENTPDSTTLHVQGTKVGTISRVSGRRGTGPSEKLLFDSSWLTMLLSLRDNGGYGPNPNLSEILWRTLCMDMSYGSQFDPEAYGSHAPAEFASQFQTFMLLIILSEADRLTLQHLDLPISTKNSVIFSDTPYDAMSTDLSSTLDEIEAITSHDGESCSLPSRQEILHYWNHFIFSLVRTTNGTEDGPKDFYLPPGVEQGTHRPVGNGFVNMSSRLARRCFGFSRAFGLVYGGRQLLTVDDKFLGMGTLSVREGDEVWVLAGLNAPAVLRMSDAAGHDGRAYEFIGSCYVHGLMHGEVGRGGDVSLVDIELV